MNLDTEEWKPFTISRLFDVKKGKRLTSEEQENGINNYVGAVSSNNGVTNHIRQEPIHDGNTISLSYNGSVGEAFYQAEPYWATDDVNALYSLYDGFNQHIGLFIATVIRQEKYRFSYGRKWSLDSMKSSIIKLPARHNDDGTLFIDESKKYSEDGYVPDWQFMENYMKSLHHKAITTNNKKQTYQIDTDTWKEFLFGSLISSIHKAKAINKDDIFKPENNDNAIPYITRTESNNGCEQLADINNIGSGYIEEGNAITIGDTTATCFYQKKDFIAGDHIVVVRADGWLNEYTGLFITTLLNNEKNKYSYGRAFLIDRIQDTVVKLPVDSSGNPDWKFMEDYIKSLPYGDRI